MASAHQEKFTRSLPLHSDIKYINSNAVDGSEDRFIREEIPRDLENGDDEGWWRHGEDDDVDNLDPFSDSDD